MLWVDDEVYVLIDGIFKALGELLIKPRVMGNMEKIPYYVCLLCGFNGKDEVMNTASKCLKTPEGIYYSVEQLIDLYGGNIENTKSKFIIENLKYNNTTYKIILRLLKNIL